MTAPSEASDYVVEHRVSVEKALTEALQAVLKVRPADPITFLTAHFSRTGKLSLPVDKCRIPPCPLTAGTVDLTAAAANDEPRREWIASRAREQYTESCRVFALIIASGPQYIESTSRSVPPGSHPVH